jgi:hypothetical protein
MGSQRKLSSYFVSPREQVVFAVRLSIVPLGILLVLAGMSLTPAVAQLHHVATFLPPDRRLEAAIVADGAIDRTLIGLLAGSAYLMVYTIVVSHRIFGPVVSIRRYIRGLIEGRPQGPLVIRKDDHFHEIAALLSELDAKLHAGAQSAK